MSNSSSSSQSASYVNSNGAGASSSSFATSPSGASSSQQAVFTPGATSSSASASASASATDTTTSATASAPAEESSQTSPTIDNSVNSFDPSTLFVTEIEIGSGTIVTVISEENSTVVTEPGIENTDSNQAAPVNATTLVFQIGSGLNELFVNTDHQDLMTGYAGTDIFELSNDSRDAIVDITTADIITDFDINEDYLTLSDNIDVSDLIFEVTDINNDAVDESTVIRLGQDGNILAVVLNTILPVVNLQEQTTSTDVANISSSSSSSSASFVTDAGAGASSEATATSPDGGTSSNVDTIFTPGATSSGSSSVAIATPEGAAVTTDVTAPAQSSPIFNSDQSENENTLNSPEEQLLDYLIGTATADILVSNIGRDILVGYGDADTFVLESNGVTQLADADIVVDFNLEDGDTIQLSSEIAFNNDIVLETADLDNNGIIESTLIRLTTGKILAIAQGTVDLLGNTILSSEIFTTALDP